MTERGAILLEVLIAMVLVTVAGASAVVAARQGLAHVERVETAERRFRDGTRLLTAHALLTRTDLETRVGIAYEGPYDVRIRRLDFDLFGVEVGGPAGTVVETVLYRPRPIQEEP